MSIKLKRCLIIAFTAVFVALAGLGILLFSGSDKTKVQADEERYFYTLAGAEIRLEEPYGLRFSIYLNDTVYNEIISGGSFKSGKSVGAIIVPYSYVEDYEAYKAANPSYTGQYLEYLTTQKDGKMIHFDDQDINASDIRYKENLGLYRLNVVVKNIKYENINRDFVAIGYIKTGSSYEYTKITNAHKRSASYVASAAIDKGISGDDLEVCKNYVKKGELNKLGVAEEDIATSDGQFNLVFNGATEYKLIYPYENGKASQNANMVFARTEFKYWFKKATGIDIPEASDNSVTYNSSYKYISLGETKVKTGAGLSASLTETGYAIKRAGNNICLFGGSDYGTINAVYEFMRRQFNYEFYTDEVYTIDVGVKYAKLINVDVEENPDITWRVIASGPAFDASGNGKANTTKDTYARRLEANTWNDYFITMDRMCHNFTVTVDLSAHPEFAATGAADQLCFSGGDTSDYLNEDLVDYVVEKMKAAIDKDTDSYCLGFTQMDEATWCQCDGCKAAKTRYGTDSGVYIKFMNACASAIAEAYPTRDINLYMFAYQATTEAPTKNRSELIIEPNLYVQIAPIYAASYYPYDAAINQDANHWGTYSGSRTSALTNYNYKYQIEQWYNMYSNADRAAGKKLLFWHYSDYYQGTNLTLPYYDFSNINDTYTYMAQYGSLVFDEARAGNRIAVDWTYMKMYVISKLGWDTHADVDALIDKFMDAYFGEAAPDVKKAYKAYSELYEAVIANNNLTGQCNYAAEILNPSFWLKAMLNTILGYFNDAYNSIAHLKTRDADLYNTLTDRILRETISIRALYERFYGDTDAFVGAGNSLADDIRSLELNLAQPIRVANSDGEVTIEPIDDHGYLNLYGNTFNNGNSMYMQDTKFGMSNVYSITFSSCLDYVDDVVAIHPLYVRGTTSAKLSAAGYTHLYFDVYFNSADYDGSTPNFSIKRGTTVTVFNLNSLSKQNNVMLYNAAGERVYKITLDQWMQVRINLSGIGALSLPSGHSGYDVLRLKMYGVAGGTVYFANATLYKAPTSTDQVTNPVTVVSGGASVAKNGNEYTFTNIAKDGETVNRFKISKDYLTYNYVNANGRFLALKVEAASGQSASFTVNARIGSDSADVIKSADGTNTVYLPAYHMSSIIDTYNDYYVDVIVTDISNCDRFKVTVTYADTMYIHDVNEFLTFERGIFLEYSFGKYELANDIDLGTSSVAAPYINGNYTEGFGGTFDGKGYTIKNGTYGNYGGLFGMITKNGVVKNLTVGGNLTDIADWGYLRNSGGTPITILAFTNSGTIQDVSVWAAYTSTQTNQSPIAIIYCSNNGTYTNVTVAALNYTDHFNNTTQSGSVDYYTKFSAFVMWFRGTEGASSCTNVAVTTNAAYRPARSGITYYDWGYTPEQYTVTWKDASGALADKVESVNENTKPFFPWAYFEKYGDGTSIYYTKVEKSTDGGNTWTDASTWVGKFGASTMEPWGTDLNNFNAELSTVTGDVTYRVSYHTTTPVFVDETSGGENFAVAQSGNVYTVTGIVADGATVNRIRIHSDLLRYYYDNGNGTNTFVNIKVETVSGQSANFSVDTYSGNTEAEGMPLDARTLRKSASGSNTVYIPALHITGTSDANYHYWLDVVVTNVSACDRFKVTVEFEDTMHIRTAAELIMFAEASNAEYKTGKYELVGNIDLGSREVASPFDNSGSRRTTSGFAGTFDGNGYTVSGGIYSKAGLFGNVLQTATVKNLTLKDARWSSSSTDDAALLAWTVSGKIQNVNIIDAVFESSNLANRAYPIYEIYAIANVTKVENVTISICNEKSGLTGNNRGVAPVVSWYSQSQSNVFSNVQATLYTQYTGTHGKGSDGSISPGGSALPANRVIITYVYTYSTTASGVMTRTTKDGKTAYEITRTRNNQSGSNYAYDDRINLLDENTYGGDKTTQGFLNGKVIAFDFYYTGDEGATFRMNNNKFKFDLTKRNVSITDGKVNIYDASGNRVDKITKNAWYTLKWNGSVLYNLTDTNKPIYFCLGEDYADFDYTKDKAYITNVRLLDEEFDNSAYVMYIHNAAELLDFAAHTLDTYKTGTYKLANDIDLGDTLVTSPVYQSGSYRTQAYCFEGTFDGQGYSIIGGRFTQAGLFGNMFVNAVVQNVNFVNSHWANSGSNAALIAWCVRGKILNVNIDAVRESTNGAAKTYVIYELFPNAQATNATELTNVKISVCNEKNAASSISPAIQWYNWSASSGTPYDGVLNNVQATMYTQYAGTSTTLDGTMPTTGITVTYVYTYDATKTGVMTRVTKDGRTAYEMKRTSTANVWESRFNLLDNNSSGGDQTTKDFLKDKVFAFDFYYTGDVGATFRTYTTMFDLTRVNSATVGYVNIYDASGNRVSRIVKNNWYTIKVNGSALYALDSDNKPFYFILGCDGSQIANAAGYNYSTDKAYISDVRLLDEEFDDSALPVTLISTAQEFLAFTAGTNSTHRYGYYKLANNIDLGDNVINAPYINGNYTAGFAGLFDGDGYVIYNGVVGDGHYGGVFGMIAPSGVIQNLGIANLYLAHSAYNSGLLNSVLCFTNNGTLSNVSVSFTYDSESALGSGKGAYPVFIYCSNAATYENVVVEAYNYSTEATAITNFKPFVSWNRGTNSYTNVYVITNSANRTVLTGVTYYDIHDTKTFTGITGDIWSDSGDVKVMAQEKIVLARYAEKHFIDLTDLTYARDMWIKRVAVDDTVSMTRLSYPQANGANVSVLSEVSGYSAYADVLSGTATADGNFELKAYYYAVTETMLINNISGCVFKSNNLRTQATTDGSWKHSITKDDAFDTSKENVYKFVTYNGYNEWYGRFMTTGFNYSSLAGKTFVFEIYVASSSGAFPYIYINHNTAAASTYKLDGTAKAINDASNSLCVYDADGVLVSSVSTGAWYKVVIDGDKLTSTQPVMELCLGANSVFYISNMHFESK